MTRIGRLTVGLCAIFLVASVARADDCGARTSGDICAAGSPWSDFTRFRVQLRGEDHEGTTTMTMYGPQDFSMDVEDAPTKHGGIIVIAGRAMLMRDVPHETGHEIDALDGAVLMHQLVITLLDQAFPKGPGAVRAFVPIKVAQKSRAIRIATASASGRLEAPWSLTGTARRAGGRIEYDLRVEFTAERTAKSPALAGFWEKAPTAPTLDEHMSLDGWTVHWLTLMTSTSDQGTTLDYGARPVSERWADLAALRTYIADEPARRASRRVPADAANLGASQTFSYAAFTVDQHGIRKSLGDRVREYRPGVDVLVEQIEPTAWRKILPLHFGLSVSATVYPKEELTGFGLVLAKDDSGFSWEWFNRDRDDMFRKLLGGGTVRVIEDAGSQQLVAVEFLDDVSLTCKNDSSAIAHEVRVKKGSVLRLKP